jgi:hypothetical protein
MHFAIVASVDFVRIIDPATLVALGNEQKRVDYIYHSFIDAHKAKSALVILDDIGKYN